MKKLIAIIKSWFKPLEGDDLIEWIVNDCGELGIRLIGKKGMRDRFFFLYKGRSLEYNEGGDDGVTMYYRPVYKREFGECCHPLNFWKNSGIGLTYPDFTDSAPIEDWKEIPKY